MQAVPMTVTGYQQLEAELNKLKKIERPKVIEAIKEARKHGDLKENAEYHAAKEKQGFIEKRIHQLEHKLSLARVIDVTKLPRNGRVVFGVSVVLYEIEKEIEHAYQIVGEDEVDLKAKKISIASPLARALIGKEVGDVVDLTTPSGLLSYEILAIHYH